MDSVATIVCAAAERRKCQAQVGTAAKHQPGKGLLGVEVVQVGDQFSQRGGLAEQRDAQPVGEPLRVAEQVVVAIRLTGQVPVKLLRGARPVAEADERGGVLKRLHQRRVGAHEGQPVLGEFQFPDDLGFKAAWRVGDGGVVAGQELPPTARTAQPRLAFEYQHAQPGAGQVAGSHQPVVAAADHYDVKVVFPGAHHRLTAAVAPVLA